MRWRAGWLAETSIALVFAITTASPKTQELYDQGLTLLHHYVWVDAARSFHEALRADPECAMCWMGLARAEQGSAAVRFASSRWKKTVSGGTQTSGWLLSRRRSMVVPPRAR